MPAPMIHCLSIWQPHATLIALGLKRDETRDWFTNYRGDLVIHASKKDDAENRIYMNDPDIRAALRAAGLTWEALPFGAALCVVSLYDCTLGSEVPTRERRFGDYGPGRYALRLNHLRVLPEPIPMRGQRGFWSIPNPLPPKPPVKPQPDELPRTKRESYFGARQQQKEAERGLTRPPRIVSSKPFTGARRTWAERARATGIRAYSNHGDEISIEDTLGWIHNAGTTVPPGIDLPNAIRALFNARAMSRLRQRRDYIKKLRENRIASDTADTHISALNAELRRMKLGFWLDIGMSTLQQDTAPVHNEKPSIEVAA